MVNICWRFEIIKCLRGAFCICMSLDLGITVSASMVCMIYVISEWMCAVTWRGVRHEQFPIQSCADSQSQSYCRNADCQNYVDPDDAPPRPFPFE